MPVLEGRRACCRAAAGAVLGVWLGVPAARAQTAPEVSIASVNSIDFHGQIAVLDLTLSIRNTAGLALPLQALRLQCGFNGIDVAQGRSTAPVTIPAGGRAMVPLRLHVDSASLLDVLANLPPDGQVHYELQGHAEIGLTMLQIPFRHRGVIALR